jgi:hypothetical protein
MILFVLVFVLSYPFALLGQPLVTQILLSTAAALVLLTPLVETAYTDPVSLVRYLVTPLLVLCLLLGNEQKLELVAAVLSAPLAVPHQNQKTKSLSG